MAPWEGAVPIEEGPPEDSLVVNEPQVPAVPWSWDTNKILIAVGSVVGVSCAIWFVIQYRGAKAAFVASEAASNGGT
jgi:hypothetical protein